MSATRWATVVGVLTAACTSSTPDPAQPTPGRPVSPPTAIATDEGCEARIATYLSDRAVLSRCETDSDCAEMWPGLCPHGPYYIDREADIAGVVAAERAIMLDCEIPECEPPMELGIGHCEAGSCARGRPPAAKGEESCWDYRETYLEAEGGASATTATAIRGITPHVVIAPASTGTLVLEVSWPKACEDCRLLISEHNSGMAHPLETRARSTDVEVNGEPMRRERIELAVTPGPYHMIGMAAVDTRFTIRAELRDTEGRAGQVTRHGVGWQRLCEG